MADERDRDTQAAPERGSNRDNKVARLIDEYGLGAEYGDRLEALWTAEGEKRESLRTLATRFNKRLLETAMTEAEMSTLDGEVENVYRLLTSDEVSSGVRTEARMRLSQEGIDTERLERDFISYQAIRSYLKEYRGADYRRESDATRVESAVETIQRLQSRIRAVTERNLRQLRDTGRISLGEFRLFVEVRVLCEDCDRQYTIVEILRRGGCECERTEIE